MRLVVRATPRLMPDARDVQMVRVACLAPHEMMATRSASRGAVGLQTSIQPESGGELLREQSKRAARGAMSKEGEREQGVWV